MANDQDPRFQHKFQVSCIDVFMPWPALAVESENENVSTFVRRKSENEENVREWVWQASPARKTRL